MSKNKAEKNLEAIRGQIRRSKPVSIKDNTKASKTTKVVLKRLFFDIETSPNVVYSWNVGYKLNLGYENIIEERAIICISYKWAHESKVQHLTWKNGCDKEMVHKFVQVMEEADEIIGHNSDQYDIKWFKTRALFHGIDKVKEFTTIDTLKSSRKHFRFNSNRLDYISKFLGFKGKVATGGFDLWKEVIAGNKTALNKMVEYCDNDVLILEKVYNKISGYLKPKTHMGVLLGKSKHSCPKCGHDHSQSNGWRISAIGIKKNKRVCQNCGHNFTISITDSEKLE